MDQWFIDYGDKTWKSDAKFHLEQMKFTDPIVKNLLNIAIDWLDQWPCSRTYGLGSNFPDSIESDPRQMIDSLSDSTIYMALYTIYHLFDGTSDKDITDDVWDYIFLLKHYDDEAYIKYKPMRDEFFHWYPMNVRISAKDLIPNHLSMSIFHHVAIWDQEFMKIYTGLYPEKPYESFGPISYEINGYISIKSSSKTVEKMSKSKGNFKTLDQAIDLYTADSIRFTFASASTGTDDSYFDQELCTRMVEKLYKEKEWITDILANIGSYLIRDMNFIDLAFVNEMMIICEDVIKAYKKMNFFEVVTKGFHILQGLRDQYQLIIDTKMHPNILKIFIIIQLTLIKPIIPHFCDIFNIGIKMCDIESFFASYGFKEINYIMHWQYDYLIKYSSDINFKILQNQKKKPVNKVKILVSNNFINPVEKIAYDIFIHNSNLSSKEVIEFAKKINQELMENTKNIGLVNVCYKNFDHIMKNYGEIVFITLTNHSNNLEYITLKDNLQLYLKRMPIDIYILEIDSADNMISKVNEPIISYL
jgi:leucyl-tRNA synthetase